MKMLQDYLKIIFPSIICALIIYFTTITTEYYPLSFGLVIGVFNWNSFKFNSFLSILLVIIASYISFFIAYFSFGLIAYIFSFMKGDNGALIAITIAPNIIGALLVFFQFSYIFKIKKTKLKMVVILFTVITLLAYSVVIIGLDFYNLQENHLLNTNTIWQIIMALAVQIIIHYNKKSVNNYEV